MSDTSTGPTVQKLLTIQQRRVIQEVLLKYCDPKPHFDGVNAGDIADIIVRRLGELESEPG